jgi:hypothetical protein
MKKRGLIVIVLLLVLAVIARERFGRPKQSQVIANPEIVHPPEAGKSPTAPRNDDQDLTALKEELLSQLKKPDVSGRTLKLPAPRPDLADEPPPAPKPLTADEKMRAQGRKKREGLPLGVVLWDNVPIYKDAQGKDVLYTMSSGDFVKVYDDSTTERRHVHPGVDVYLAATSKEIETAGNRFPDKAGWVDRSQLQVFGPERAKEFTQATEPMTLGRDNFSTVDFYERAFKNPDPVVHRVVGPRLIGLLSLHEDYSSAWGRLYRDPDEKIRAVTLATLRERGAGKSAPLIEDLISRLIELKSKGGTDSDPEVALITDILKESGSPRAQNALKSLSE